MLVTDQDYPRAYGDNHGLLYYIVAAPGTRPLCIAGAREPWYRVVGPSSAFATEAQLPSDSYQRVPLSARLATEALEFWRNRC